MREQRKRDGLLRLAVEKLVGELTHAKRREQAGERADERRIARAAAGEENFLNRFGEKAPIGVGDAACGETRGGGDDVLRGSSRTRRAAAGDERLDVLRVEQL